MCFEPKNKASIYQMMLWDEGESWINLPLSNAIPLISFFHCEKLPDTNTPKSVRRVTYHMVSHKQGTQALSRAPTRTPLRRDHLEETEADTRNARHLTTLNTRARARASCARPQVQKALPPSPPSPFASASAIRVRASWATILRRRRPGRAMRTKDLRLGIWVVLSRKGSTYISVSTKKNTVHACTVARFCKWCFVQFWLAGNATTYCTNRPSTYGTISLAPYNFVISAQLRRTICTIKADNLPTNLSVYQ